MTEPADTAPTPIDQPAQAHIDRIEMIDINNLIPNPDQPRQHFDPNVINEG